MTWKFDNPLATLKCGALEGRADASQPHLGVHDLRFNASALAGRICSVEREEPLASSNRSWPAKLSDAYIRGDDLVATYHATNDWPFAPQIYWRPDSIKSTGGALASMSLVVSVSTHLLDTHPRISAVSELAADEVLHVTSSADGNARTSSLLAQRQTVIHPDGGACCLVWRLPGGRFSYTEIVPASDFRQLTVQRKENGDCHARWELIADFLEKGVIRRTRLESAFLPRERDIQLAVACCRQFAERPLPLTT